MTELDFQYFSEVARTLNFSKAAENLFITQSALSRCIQKIEGELGAKLFERNRHDVKLTNAGNVLLSNYNTVQKANSMLKMAVLNAERLDTQDTIRIGIQNGHLISEKLKQKIRAFSTSSTPVSIEVQSLSYNELFQQLREKMIDVAFAYEFPFRNYSDFEKRFLEEDRCEILVSDTHPITGCRTEEERISMLKSMNLLCTGKEHQTHLFPFLLEQCRKHGFEPKGVQYYPSDLDMANALIMEKGFLVVSRTERMTVGRFYEMPNSDPLNFTAFSLKDGASEMTRRFLETL